MPKLPKFKCNDCGKKLDMFEVNTFQEASTTYDIIDGSPTTYEIRLCEKCNNLRLGNKEKATEKQKGYLKSLGFKDNMEELTITEESKLIKGLLKKNKE